MNTSSSSASTEADRFGEDLDDMIAGDKSNDELVWRTKQLIESLAGRRDPNEFVPRWYRRCQAKMNKILEAMLAFSSKCGGAHSQRYVACAVIACTAGTKSSEETHRALTDLALSWFSNFLWICKSIL
jgi:hypothetical protein